MPADLAWGFVAIICVGVLIAAVVHAFKRPDSEPYAQHPPQEFDPDLKCPVCRIATVAQAMRTDDVRIDYTLCPQCQRIVSISRVKEI